MVFFDRLIGIGVGADRDDIRLVLPRRQFPGQNVGRIGPGDQPGFKIQTRRQAQIGMAGARKAVDAAMLAPAVGIDRTVEPDIGRSVSRDHLSRTLDADFGPDRRQIVVPVPAVIDRNPAIRIKPIVRVAGRAPPAPTVRVERISILFRTSSTNRTLQEHLPATPEPARPASAPCQISDRSVSALPMSQPAEWTCDKTTNNAITTQSIWVLRSCPMADRRRYHPGRPERRRACPADVRRPLRWSEGRDRGRRQHPAWTAAGSPMTS